MTTRSTTLNNNNNNSESQLQQQSQSQTRKMRSNPIPISSSWQMRNKSSKNDPTLNSIQQSYDTGSFHDSLIQNSLSPQSYQSLSSPSQSLSPIKEFSRLMKPQVHHQQHQQQQQQQQQISTSFMLNDLNSLEIQTELESLLVNATLNEATNTNHNHEHQQNHHENEQMDMSSSYNKKCDPVLTQIALNKQVYSSHMNNHSNGGGGGVDDVCLASINVANLKTSNVKQHLLPSVQKLSIKRGNLDNDFLTQYSNSLPSSSFIQYMDMNTLTTPTDIQIQPFMVDGDLDGNNYQESNIQDDNKNSNDHSFLSMSLPSYTLIDDFISHKKAKLTLNHASNDQQQSSYSYGSNSYQSLNNSHLNKLLTSSSTHKGSVTQFNSDSNLSSTALSSPQQANTNQEQDVKPSIQSLKRSSIAHDNCDEFEEDGMESLGETDDDSDDESMMNNDGILDLMNKTRDNFFWQYNIQSKGPKTKKVLTLRNKDPHLHRDFFDPVYQLQTINARGTSLNKLRKGDGNDVTPNADKLYNLGIQIRDFIQKSYAINNISSANEASALASNSEKLNIKREKNKIASRACRLKKKAQHEANKLKLNGLNEEHKQLVDTINVVKDLIKKRLTSPSRLPNGSSLTGMLNDVAQQKLTLKVAGNADNHVLALMQNVERERTAKLLQNQMMTT